MAELKKCPFCGSEKLKIDSKSGKIHYYEKDGMREWQHVVFSVRCNKCNARGGAVGVDLPTVGRLGDFTSRKAETEKKAIEAWNNRATEAELRASVIDEFAERLKERIVGMQIVELQGEDVCPCAETGEECPYINQDIGCQYCAREHTIKEIAEIASQMKGEKE